MPPERRAPSDAPYLPPATRAEPECPGAQTIAAVRRFAPSRQIERKLLYGNSKKLFRL
ncbi:MAG: hypothetical protein MUF81_20155 [Verrucomicrobia bacterium]|jgi:hypothetical protein|nr:hypothetical protein [Verrucomicrobiota bacterium]